MQTAVPRVGIRSLEISRNLLEQDLENMVAVKGPIFCVMRGICSPRATDVLGLCHDRELNSVLATSWVFFVELHHEDAEELQHTSPY